MKSGFRLTRLAFAAIVLLLMAGCLLKTSTVPVRHFILAPISTNAPPSTASEPLSVGISFVKMPSYLLRSSLAIRSGDNEITYIDGALWGERLDQNFQRTIAANLSRLLPSDNIFSTDWGRNQVMLRVFVNVQQFDVDTTGHGVMVAHWRITPPDDDTSLKSGTVHLDRAGSPPHDDPKIIATTLSDLTAAFSRDLAQSIRECAKKKP